MEENKSPLPINSRGSLVFCSISNYTFCRKFNTCIVGQPIFQLIQVAHLLLHYHSKSNALTTALLAIILITLSRQHILLKFRVHCGRRIQIYQDTSASKPKQKYTMYVTLASKWDWFIQKRETREVCISRQSNHCCSGNFRS